MPKLFNGYLQKIYYYPKQDENISNRVYKFQEVRDSMIKNNQMELIIISKFVKDSFN